jgi:hypothetical protein
VSPPLTGLGAKVPPYPAARESIITLGHFPGDTTVHSELEDTRSRDHTLSSNQEPDSRRAEQ